MKEQMFEELVGSVREAGAILRGRQKPSRRIVIRSSGVLERTKPFKVEVCASDLRKRQEIHLDTLSKITPDDPGLS